MPGVSQQNRSNIADADGSTTVFNFTFFAYSTDDIKVYSVLDDVLTPITVGITKNLNASFIGGNITFGAAPADAVGKILIRRENAYTQETEFTDITRYKETAIETALNTLSLQIQQINEENGRAPKYTESASVSDAIIETPEDDCTLVFDGTDGRIKVGQSQTNLNTLAAISAEIAAVAAIDSEIVTVAGITGNIATVAGISANITTVAGISGAVTTVAGISANVTTVAGISGNVTTVAGISAAVTTVAGISAAVSTVSGIQANVTTVAGIAASVSTVAGISAAVSTVAGIDTETVAVAAIAADVTSVAAIDTDVTAVAAIDTDVTQVSSIHANVTTVAGISANVTTVAGISGNVTTVAGISANVTTVAGISANVTTVAGISTAVSTVATNIAVVQDAAASLDMAIKYTFASSTVMGDPGAGLLRLNNATPSAVTAIAIDDLSALSGNPDISAFIISWDDSTNAHKGTLRIAKAGSPTTFAIYTITGLTDNVGWTELAVTYVTGSGSFTAADSMYLAFTRTGNLGATGATGSVPIANGAGSVDVITADFTPDQSLADNLMVLVVSTGVNTITTPSLNTDGTGALTIKKRGGAALVAGDTGAAGYTMLLRYEATGTYWELLNPAKVVEADHVFADNVTGDASTTQHGFMPKGTNTAGYYYNSANGQTNPVLVSLLTGYASGAGTVSATDTTLTAIQKLNGNIAALVSGGNLALITQSTAITVGATHLGKTVELTGSVDRTWDFTAAATLGASWAAVLVNNSTAELTLDPNGAETIDGLTNFKMYPQEMRLVVCTGSAFKSYVLKEFDTGSRTSTWTFTKPPGYTEFEARLGAGGGSGGCGIAAGAAGGGGGGAAVWGRILASTVGTTETVTIGDGGVTVNTQVQGNVGGNTTFGSLLTSYGGNGGGLGNSSTTTGGGGGGWLSAGTGSGATTSIGGEPWVSVAVAVGTAADTIGLSNTYGGAFGGGAGTTQGNNGGRSIWGGGGGGSPSTGATAVNGAGGDSMYGGGGGGAGAEDSAPGAGAGGASKYGGAGGAGGFDANTATSGTASANGCGGGGGGGSETGNSGAGGKGSSRIIGVV